MAIKRYIANADNSITNAFESDLSTRGTGSNMGAADSLEVFSLYGQTSSSSGASNELSRIIIKFPIAGTLTASAPDILTDRNASKIPASGSVNFYLKLYNAEHPYTLGRDYQLNIYPVSSSWEEGYGLDMEEYKDLTYDSTGSNWDRRGGAGAWGSVPVAATAVDAIDTTGLLADRYNDASFTISISTAAGGLGGTAITFLLDASESTGGTGAANQIMIGTDDGITDAARAALIIKAINAVTDSKVNYATSGNGQAGYDIGVTAAEGSSDTQITLTMDTTGVAGNITSALASVSGVDIIDVTAFTGGQAFAASTGGDYRTDYNFTASFLNGWEDLEVDVTPIVERWMQTSGTALHFDNHGFLIKLTDNQEAASFSYYTKKFFARSTEFFYKRPVIEARWDSRTKDQRGSIYYSSSLAPAADNLNTIYLYNYIRGKLTNIPNSSSVATTGSIMVSLYSGSSSPTGSKLLLPAGGGVVATNDVNITGGYVSTGIYSASFAVTGATSLVSSSAPLTRIFDVWHNGTGILSLGGKTEYYTGSISPKSLSAYNNAPTFEHVTAITNLKSQYFRNEVARFRLFVREKNWNPNIYTVTTTTPVNETIVSASYKIIRLADELAVVPYGTGSSYETYLSHDVSGNYFDLSMKLLESDYAYGVKLSYYNPSIATWVEQPEIFKFRVEQ
tara:strand:+ start:306 stop:2339 length:2034 start_codon:yes stop_codon:yes gene_type:complete